MGGVTLVGIDGYQMLIATVHGRKRAKPAKWSPCGPPLDL